MQSESLAISPNLIYSYAWKVPAARPAIFDRAQVLAQRSEERPSRLGHASIPWKAYLALRDFQHLASDIAEAYFAERPPVHHEPAPYPSILKGTEIAGATAESSRGLLAPVLPDGALCQNPHAIAA